MDTHRHGLAKPADGAGLSCGARVPGADGRALARGTPTSVVLGGAGR
ncbi:MAG: hypothetical protein HY021_09300 [Burkholderiales bacterium]|nr:hypothetical protein [Burkholderiales bacterium]